MSQRGLISDMDYCLGPGDGLVTAWDQPANADMDGDGVFDAVRLDFDGDGRFDDVMWDSNLDGSADHSVLDLDDDGRPETYFTDQGFGTWGFHVERSGTIAWFGLDGVEHPSAPADVDADGTDEQLLDSDGNGVADRAIRENVTGSTVFVDATADGRWDIELTDTNGDGTADTSRAVPRADTE